MISYQPWIFRINKRLRMQLFIAQFFEIQAKTFIFENALKTRPFNL
jgi:hypothetical protein